MNDFIILTLTDTEIDKLIKALAKDLKIKDFSVKI